MAKQTNEQVFHPNEVKLTSFTQQELLVYFSHVEATYGTQHADAAREQARRQGLDIG